MVEDQCAIELQAWDLALEMLEDEHSDIRQQAARSVASALKSLTGLNLAGARVEYVQQQAWAAITQHYEAWPAFVTFLLAKIWK